MNNIECVTIGELLNSGYLDKVSSDIDKNSYELSYYKDGAYWDLVVYQKFSEENNVEN